MKNFDEGRNQILEHQEMMEGRMDKRQLGDLDFEVIAAADSWSHERDSILSDLRDERERVVEYMDHLRHRNQLVGESCARVEAAKAVEDKLGDFDPSKLQPRPELLAKAGAIIEQRVVVIQELQTCAEAAADYLRHIDDAIDRLRMGLEEPMNAEARMASEEIGRAVGRR